MVDVILSILEEMGITKPNIPMEEDILEATNEIDNPTTKDIEKELTTGVKVLLKTKNKKAWIWLLNTKMLY